MIVHCPYCDATGPFSKLIEVAQAIDVTFELDENKRIIDRIVPDAQATEENICLVGFRCESCKRILTNLHSADGGYSLL
jgi:hypothetical protein